MPEPADVSTRQPLESDELGPGRLVRPAYATLCICVLSAVTACAAAGLLSLPLTAAYLVVAAGAWAAGDRLRARQPLSPRSVVASCLIALPWPVALLTTGAPTQLAEGVMPAEALAVVAGGLLCAQLLRTDGPRSAVLALALAVTCVMLAGTRSTDPLPLLAMTVCLVTALTTLALAHRTHLRCTAVSVAVHLSGPRPRVTGLLRLGRLVAVVGLLAVVTALVVPLAGSGGGGLGGLGGGALRGSGGDGAGSVRSAEAYTSGLLDLGVRGPLPDEPVVRVPADSPVLWRGTVLTTYAGGQWSAGGAAQRDDPAAAVLRRPERTDAVQDLGGLRGVLLSPGPPTGVGGGVRTFASEGATLLLGATSARSPASYTVRSRSGAADDAVLDAIPVVAPSGDAGLDSALALPPELPARVRELGQRLVASASSRRDAVQAVEEHLRSVATYDLDSPVPSAGVDPVDDFLFTSRTGFCEHFASAAAILLRAGGVPARLVTGFAASGAADAGGGRVVRANEAHAWIEVWYPGVGWSESDPTAGTTLAGPHRSAADELRRWLGARGHRLALAAGLLLLAGAVAIGVALRRRRRGRRRPATAADGPSSEGTLALRRLEHALEQIGAPRLPSETLAELGTRLSADLADDLPEGLAVRTRTALRCLEQEHYGLQRPSSAERRRAVEELGALAALVLARSRTDAVNR